MQVNNKKVLGLVDIILMTLTSNFGIRWIAVAAGIGPSSLCLWLFGAILFFLPLSIMTAQMSRLYPQEGGLYLWVKETLGEKHGFMVAWLYWVNTLFFYPAVLIFLASNMAYAIAKPDLVNNVHYITTVSLLGFWLIVAMSLLGLKISKYFVDFGGLFGLFVPMTLLIAFGAVTLFYFHHSATDFHWSQFIPGGKVVSNLSSLAMIMFAMSGVEVVATFANRVQNPKRDLYLGLLLGSMVVFFLYVVGTLAMNVLANPSVLQKTSGFVQTFALADNQLHMAWLTRYVAICLSVAELAAIVVWLLAPVLMFFKCTPTGVLPSWLHKTDANGTPIQALLLQGLLVSVIIILTSALPNVNAMYQVLVLMTTILYFLPYFFLVSAYARSLPRLAISKVWGYLMVGSVVLSLIFGILVSFIPGDDLKSLQHIIYYEAELFLGPLFFLVIGWLLYRRRRG